MKRLLPLALAVLGATSSVVQADATLVYGLKETMSEAVDQTFSISRFFARVDASGQEGKYLLFQAGKFFPLFSVDTKEGRYTRLTPPVRATLHPAKKTQAPAAQPLAGDDRETKAAKAVEAEPTPEPVEAETVEKEPKAELAATSGRSGSEVAAAAGGATAADPAQAAVPNEVKPAERPVLPKVPQFKPTRTTDEVAGVRCRVILELIDGKPAIEHCMANTAALGITERESRTLARLFVMARERGYDWLGAATKDEDFVSVRSRDLGRGKTLTLESVSTKALPVGHLRVPKAFKEVAAQPSPAPAKADAPALSPPQSPPQSPAQSPVQSPTQSSE